MGSTPTAALQITKQISISNITISTTSLVINIFNVIWLMSFYRANKKRYNMTSITSLAILSLSCACESARYGEMIPSILPQSDRAGVKFLKYIFEPLYMGGKIVHMFEVIRYAFVVAPVADQPSITMPFICTIKPTRNATRYWRQWYLIVTILTTIVALIAVVKELFPSIFPISIGFNVYLCVVAVFAITYQFIGLFQFIRIARRATRMLNSGAHVIIVVAGAIQNAANLGWNFYLFGIMAQSWFPSCEDNDDCVANIQQWQYACLLLNYACGLVIAVSIFYVVLKRIQFMKQKQSISTVDYL